MSQLYKSTFSNTAPHITVIIPTTCERQRWAALNRAIDSVLMQHEVNVELIVVVNGSRYDPESLARLEQREDLKLLYRLTGSAPLAQLAGRETVTAPFFAFLDDDDEYLPNGLLTRVTPLIDDPTLDFVVTNGLRNIDNIDVPTVPYTSHIARDPLLALTQRNWIASCGGLFRTRTVSTNYFSNPAPFMEWTFLAFRLLIKHKMCFLNVPTYRLHDSPGSLSKSDAYIRGEVEVVQRVLTLPLPKHVRKAMLRKLGQALHTAVELYWRDGERKQAWKAHLRSLRLPGGWRYLLYTRRLGFRNIALMNKQKS